MLLILKKKSLHVSLFDFLKGDIGKLIHPVIKIT